LLFCTYTVARTPSIASPQSCPTVESLTRVLHRRRQGREARPDEGAARAQGRRYRTGAGRTLA
jgi:hypothetical protein